ncbi:MAG: hypothetical protein ACKO35_05090 [Planctomycetaceae bacterium]
MRADDVVERAGTRIAPQPVGATILLVEPAVGEVVRVREVAKHDRPIGHLRPDHAMPRLDENVDEMLQVAACEAVPRAGLMPRGGVRTVGHRAGSGRATGGPAACRRPRHFSRL